MELNSSSLRNSSNSRRGVLALVSVWQNSFKLFIVIVALYFVFIVIGISLNAMVCYVMIKSRRYLRNISSFFITHLAGVDLIYRVLLTPSMVYLSLPSSVSHMDSIPCKTSAFVAKSCAAAIFGSLVVIAIDRYRNIVHPLSSLKHTKRPVRMVVWVWLYAVASSVMFLFTARNTPLDKLPETKNINRVGNPATSCDISPGFLGGFSVTISMVMTFVVPLVTFIITYTAIFVRLRRRCQSSLVHQAAFKSKAKSARMLVIVVIGFVACYGPAAVVTLLRSYGSLNKADTQYLVITVVVTDMLELCSSLVNPLVYAFYSSDFRQDVLGMCGISRVNLFHRKKIGWHPDSRVAKSTA